jgi:hypothetical protein
MENSVEIQLSKFKLTLMLLGSIVFLGLGVLMEVFIINQPISQHTIFQNLLFLRFLGIACILFFGLCAYEIKKKLSAKSIGLVVSDEGIVDNSSPISVGLIPWADILEIKEVKVVKQNLINIVVKNPQDYIDKQSNAFKRKIMQANYRSFSAVISITSNGLKYDYKGLKSLLDQRFMDFKNKNN